MKFLIVIEPTRTSFSAYSPGLRGASWTGETREKVGRSMREAVELYVEGLREEGYPVP